jgi:tRNA (guanine-N7-)-methyltransferase
VKTAKDLIIPFSWEERRPIMLENFFYIPTKCEYSKKELSLGPEGKPIIIEYCSGNGEWIGERAKQNPEFHFLAVEKRFERARKIWLKIYREEIPNLTVICGEALTFTRFYAPKAHSIYVNFPDPWPKLRHAKHRLITLGFIDEVSQILPSKAKATLVTDDLPYAEQMRSEFAKTPDWKVDFYGTEFPDYGNSFFKDLWLKKGKTIYYLSYEKL